VGGESCILEKDFACYIGDAIRCDVIRAICDINVLCLTRAGYVVLGSLVYRGKVLWRVGDSGHGGVGR
jgi:hypothetical protein